MKKALIVIANYSDNRQKIFDDHFSLRNAKFAEIHGYDYIVSRGGEVIRGNPTWWKFTIIKDYLDKYDQILHLDADMRIDKFDKDYPCSKSFTVAIDNGNTFCMGSYKINVNDWSRRLIDNILDEGLYNNNKDTNHWQNFREQAAFYTLCGIPPHSWIPFMDLPNNGFHNCVSADTLYGLEELEDNIEVIGPEWNTTLLEEESDRIGQALMQYNIVKSKSEDTRIRHFAGGQTWMI